MRIAAAAAAWAMAMIWPMAVEMEEGPNQN